MYFDPGSRSYSYRVRSSLDPGRLGNTEITMDADDGHVLAFSPPTGGAPGTTLTTWIEDIHTANIIGRPMQVVISATGLTVAMLSATGVLIYFRKRKASAPAAAPRTNYFVLRKRKARVLQKSDGMH